MFAVIAQQQSLSAAKGGLYQTMQTVVEEASNVPTTIFDANRTLSLEGLCKTEKGEVSRGTRQSCCPVCVFPVQYHSHFAFPFCVFFSSLPFLGSDF